MISITQQYVNDIGDSMKEIIITVKKNISADVTRIIEIRTFKKRGILFKIYTKIMKIKGYEVEEIQ